MSASASTRTKKKPAKKADAAKKTDAAKELYRHSKRPEWGLAALAWENESCRAYQFEDGQLRKIKNGYYALIERAEEVKGSHAAILEGLDAAVQANKGKAPPKPQKAVAPFAAQVVLFEQLYPKGFGDPKWIEEHRRGNGRALKRHREPVVEEAGKALSKEALEAAIAEDGQDAVAGAIFDLLEATTLVPLEPVRTLRRLDENERREFVEAVHALLHGDGAFNVRFRRYLTTLRGFLGARPSWRVATVLPALVFPNEHVCVRRSAFVRQAGSIAPTARYSKRARMVSYKNFQRVALAVEERLKEAGHEPRDLLDIHDFIWATLRQSALDHIGQS